MAVQVIQSRGGRRFGPSALAAQARRAAEAPVRVATGPEPTAPPRAAVPAVPRILGAARPPRVGESTRPGRGAMGYRRVPVGRLCDGDAAGGYRMGRWARLAMTLVVTAAIVVGTLTLALRPAPTPTRFVTVQPGDTVASVALRDMPGWDLAAAVEAIEALNRLDGAAVPVGTVLRLPAGQGVAGR